MSTFTPVFSNYSVVIMDYTGDHWPDATRTAFLDFVRNGGGVVIYHAADNAFPDWPEYNELIGLGGWGNRSEKHGPYVFWRDGALVRDMRPGPGGAHGKQHQYVITHRVTDHPVTRGLPERWLHEKDELYHHLRGPAHNMTLLATAWSAPETGGSGEHEPVLFTIAYGKGRVFHTVLGHAGDDPPPAMQCVGFIVTVQRGTEWAATGQVTQPIPDDFPSEEQVRLRPQFKRTNPDKLLEELAAYTFGDSLEPLVTLEALARTRLSAKASLKDLQAGYVRLLESDAATVAAKNFACKQLSLFGNADAVPVLAALLGTAETASMARYALERIPGDESLNALRAALPVSTPEQLPGLIASLGAKQNLDTLPVIIPFLKSNDAQVAEAAIEALACMACAACVACVAGAALEAGLPGLPRKGRVARKTREVIGPGTPIFAAASPCYNTTRNNWRKRYSIPPTNASQVMPCCRVPPCAGVLQRRKMKRARSLWTRYGRETPGCPQWRPRRCVIRMIHPYFRRLPPCFLNCLQPYKCR